jgi:hypothetical protein
MWEITWYEKIGDKMLGTITLKNIDSLELKKVFSQPLDEPMIYMYSINENHANYLQNIVDQENIDHKINLEDYEYFLESFPN